MLGIPPNLFAQKRGIPFNIKYIVCNLKCPPNGMSVAFQSLYLSWRTAPSTAPMTTAASINAAVLWR